MEHQVNLTGAYKRILRTEIEFAQSVIRDLPENRQLFLTLIASPYISEAAREYIMQLSPYTTISDTMISADILESLRERLRESSGPQMISGMVLSDEEVIHNYMLGVEIFKSSNMEMC